MKKLCLYLVDIYRKYLSPLKRTPCCRFQPTCSSYMYQAIEEWGAVKGIILGILRILRCNPLFPAGIDNVPLRGSKKRSNMGYMIYYSYSPEHKRCRKKQKSFVK